MPELTMDSLTDHERAELAQAMAMLDPYLKLTAVDWTVKPPKESTE